MEKKATLPFPRYIRKGECKRCGWCCLQEDPPCPHLFIDKVTGKSTCKIHKSEDRPEKCKVYPGNPPIVHPECGYYFVDRWDNGRKVKCKV